MKLSFLFAVLLGSILLSGCSAMRDAPVNKPVSPFEQSQMLLAQGQFDAAYNENEKIFQEGRAAPDLALFNMGMISAHSANPKRNYARALSSFRTLVKNYPQSQMVEPAKTWIQVLEEYQKLLEEKRVLLRERESLTQEKEKLKYTIEKSRHVDLDIEKRRREALRK
jgi:hypothetical protein